MRIDKIVNEKMQDHHKAAIKGMHEIPGDQYYDLYKYSKDVAGHDGKKTGNKSDDEISDKGFAYAYTDAEDKMIKGATGGKSKKITSNKSIEDESVNKVSAIGSKKTIDESVLSDLDQRISKIFNKIPKRDDAEIKKTGNKPASRVTPSVSSPKITKKPLSPFGKKNVEEDAQSNLPGIQTPGQVSSAVHNLKQFQPYIKQAGRTQYPQSMGGSLTPKRISLNNGNTMYIFSRDRYKDKPNQRPLATVLIGPNKEVIGKDTARLNDEERQYVKTWMLNNVHNTPFDPNPPSSNLHLRQPVKEFAPTGDDSVREKLIMLAMEAVHNINQAGSANKQQGLRSQAEILKDIRALDGWITGKFEHNTGNYSNDWVMRLWHPVYFPQGEIIKGGLGESLNEFDSTDFQTTQSPEKQKEKDVDIIFYGVPGKDWRADDGWAALEEVLPGEYPRGSERAQYKIAEVQKNGGAIVTTKPLSVAKQLVNTFAGYGIKAKINSALREGTVDVSENRLNEYIDPSEHAENMAILVMLAWIPAMALYQWIGKIINYIKLHGAENIINSFEKKGITVDRATYERIEPLLDDLKQELTANKDGTRAKALAKRIKSEIDSFLQNKQGMAEAQGRDEIGGAGVAYQAGYQDGKRAKSTGVNPQVNTASWGEHIADYRRGMHDAFNLPAKGMGMAEATVEKKPGVDLKGRTQQAWIQTVKSKFPTAKITQAKMIDGPCVATLPDGKKMYWKKAESVAEGNLNEFVPPNNDGGDNERSRRLRKLLEIAIQVAKQKNVDELGMIHAMNTIAGDEFFDTAVEGILPDITDKEYMFVLQSAYKTVKQGLAEGPTDDPKFQKMMGTIQKNTPDPVSGYVAVSYASERPSKKISGATVNGKPMPATTNDPGQLIKDLKFTPDRIEQQLTVLGQKYGWDLIEPGQGQGYTDVYFDTNKEFTTQKQLAAMIVKTVAAINKYFSDMNRSLQATGLPAYQINVWQGMGPTDHINQIEDLKQITNIAQGKDTKADPGPAIGRMILKYIPEYEAENDELGYDLKDFANAKKVANIYINNGERAGLQAQHKLDSHVSEMIDELLSDHGGISLRTIWDLDEQGMAEAEGDAVGLPHLTRHLVKDIADQINTEGPHAISKSVEYGDGAAKELTAYIQKALRDLEHKIK